MNHLSGRDLDLRRHVGDDALLEIDGLELVVAEDGSDAEADQEDEDNRHDEAGAVGTFDLVGLAHLS